MNIRENDGKYINPSVVIKNRIDIIRDYARNKVVLDVGCVDHDAGQESSNSPWLHGVMKNVAKEITGVDFENEEVNKLNKKGYNIVVGNVETINLGKFYDLIVAGELIEHLSNPGIFLDNMNKQLKEDGRLILTTPNTYCLRYVLKNIVTGMVVPNPQHTFYFDYFTLKELCERHNFVVEKSYYFFDMKSNSIMYWIYKFFSLIHKSYTPRIMFILKKKQN